VVGDGSIVVWLAAGVGLWRSRSAVAAPAQAKAMSAAIRNAIPVDALRRKGWRCG
jgi:hypothetical protein